MGLYEDERRERVSRLSSLLGGLRRPVFGAMVMREKVEIEFEYQ